MSNEPDPDTIDIPTGVIASLIKKYGRAILAALGGMAATALFGALGAFGQVAKIPTIEAEVQALRAEQQRQAFNAWVTCQLLTQLHPTEKAAVEFQFKLRLDCGDPVRVSGP